MSSEFEKRPLTTYEEPTVPAEEDLSMCLSPEDTKTFYALKGEMKESWEKRQVYRTEVEMRIGVLEDFRHPTPSAKYWQAVREMSHYYENVVNGYFEYKRNEIQIKKLERQIQIFDKYPDLSLVSCSKNKIYKNIVVQCGHE